MNYLTRVTHLFGPKASDLPEIKEGMKIENIKINGFASLLFKSLLSVLTLAVTVALSISAKKIMIASAITVIGFIILLNIINYSFGTRVTYEKGKLILMEGIFKDGKFVRGKVFTHTGHVYVGTFEQGKLVQGKAYFPSGAIYEGSWKNSQFVKGTILHPVTEGPIEQGEFIHSLLVKGVRIYPDGRVLAGTFEKNQLIDGTITYQDGTIAPVRVAS